MFIDMHSHTNAISRCCGVYSEKVFELAKEKGYDGLVISNHYTSLYFNDDTYDKWIEKYILEWRNCKKIALKLGMKCFCGIEVSVYSGKELHFLIYGAPEKFLLDNPFLCKKTQKELFDLCNKYDLALVQAHPFRLGTTIQDTNYLHGLEVNCHPLYGNTYAETIMRVAKEKNLALTVGCDYHGDTYRSVGGSFLPDNVLSDSQLADYIRNSNQFSFVIDEPKSGKIYSTHNINRK